MPTPPLGDIGIGQLIARIDASWDTRAEIRAKLGEQVPTLRRRAEQTNELLLGLLKEHGRGRSDVAEPAGPPEGRAP